ncbi:hypothetical protein SSS_07161 [Sarcoptes scabiei]|uniref:CRAL-TRIO domain-containing protein n=1 Tax=Sarcoptes scabiei TaxID=52283 RepID=A0A131ZYE9_SARSC|nr:hypothetical protein SSS_07161 [Sarcoptes scabiei]KPM03868.1 CRAL/TRIO domain containing protein 1 [Sarcoptes scabiei]
MKLMRDKLIDEKLIEELRDRINEYVGQNPTDIDIEDVQNRIRLPAVNEADNNNNNNNNQIELKEENEKIRPDESISNGTDEKVEDWMLKRFLLMNKRQVDKAFENFLEFFRFRNQYQLRTLTAGRVLAEEYFRVKPFDFFGRDKQNNRVWIVHLRYYKKISQLDLLLKLAIFYFFEQFDLEYERKRIDGICMIIDCRDFGITNLDLDLFHFLVKQIPFSYAGLVRNVLIYELPFLLQYLVKIVESWLPSYTDKDGNQIKFFSILNRKNIDEHFEPKEIDRLTSVGKKSKRNPTDREENGDEEDRNEFLDGIFNEPPPNCLTMRQLCSEWNLKEANANKIDQHVKQLLDDLE